MGIKMARSQRVPLRTESALATVYHPGHQCSYEGCSLPSVCQPEQARTDSNRSPAHQQVHGAAG